MRVKSEPVMAHVAHYDCMRDSSSHSNPYSLFPHNESETPSTSDSDSNPDALVSLSNHIEAEKPMTISDDCENGVEVLKNGEEHDHEVLFMDDDDDDPNSQTIYVVAEGMDTDEVVRLVEEGKLINGEDGIVLSDGLDECPVDDVAEYMDDSSLSPGPLDVSDVVEVEVPFDEDEENFLYSSDTASMSSRSTTPDLLQSQSSSEVEDLEFENERSSEKSEKENVVVEKIEYTMPVIKKEILDSGTSEDVFESSASDLPDIIALHAPVVKQKTKSKKPVKKPVKNGIPKAKPKPKPKSKPKPTKPAKVETDKPKEDKPDAKPTVKKKKSAKKKKKEKTLDDFLNSLRNTDISDERLTEVNCLLGQYPVLSGLLNPPIIKTEKEETRPDSADIAQPPFADLPVTEANQPSVSESKMANGDAGKTEVPFNKEDLPMPFTPEFFVWYEKIGKKWAQEYCGVPPEKEKVKKKKKKKDKSSAPAPLPEISAADDQKIKSPPSTSQLESTASADTMIRLESVERAYPFDLSAPTLSLPANVKEALEATETVSKTQISSSFIGISSQSQSIAFLPTQSYPSAKPPRVLEEGEVILSDNLVRNAGASSTDPHSTAVEGLLALNPTTDSANVTPTSACSTPTPTPSATPTSEPQKSSSAPNSATPADKYIKHWKPTGRYKCVLCSYSSVTKNYLYRHWLVHHNKMLYAYCCPYCEYRGTYKDSVTRHIGRWHKEEKRTVVIDHKTEEEALVQFKALFNMEVSIDRFHANGSLSTLVSLSTSVSVPNSSSDVPAVSTSVSATSAASLTSPSIPIPPKKRKTSKTSKTSCVSAPTPTPTPPPPFPLPPFQLPPLLPPLHSNAPFFNIPPPPSFTFGMGINIPPPIPSAVVHPTKLPAPQPPVTPILPPPFVAAQPKNTEPATSALKEYLISRMHTPPGANLPKYDEVVNNLKRKSPKSEVDVNCNKSEIQSSTENHATQQA